MSWIKFDHLIQELEKCSYSKEGGFGKQKGKKGINGIFNFLPVFQIYRNTLEISNPE